MAFKWFKKKKDTRNQVQQDSLDEHLPDEENDNDFPAESENSEIDSERTIEEEFTAEPAVEDVHERESKGYFKRLRSRLSKSRKTFSGGFDRIFAGKKRIDDDALEELEELLITSDIGVQTTMELIERISKVKVADPGEIKQKLKDEILSILGSNSPVIEKFESTPQVILVVGVNGVGKTTTIGKIAASLTASGKKVMIAAADTFRAAAVEQLMIWAERAGAEFVRHKENADPAAVAFDAIAAASARGCDVVLIDTAGRLHTKVNLMEELKKIKRTAAKQVEGAPHEILLVLDATTGQNALSQAKLFNDALDITGLALTKLDGTAKGGIVIGICGALNVPLQYIGIGEKIEDLRPFDAELFIDALF
jgi:fused signal recognition particle receptor